MKIEYSKTEIWNFEVPETEKFKVRATQNETHSNLCSIQRKLPD